MIFSELIRYQEAHLYALELLQSHLPSNLFYHSLEHTRAEVVPAAKQLCRLEQIDFENTLLIETAAYYHDTGFTIQINGHEFASIEIVEKVLPQFGFSEAQVHSITSMIMATRLPQNPGDFFSKVLADADLYILGSPTYLDRNQDLRRELAYLSLEFEDCDWFSHQIHFLQGHHYFTKSAQQFWDPEKKRNIRRLKEKFQSCSQVNEYPA